MARKKTQSAMEKIFDDTMHNNNTTNTNLIINEKLTKNVCISNNESINNKREINYKSTNSTYNDKTTAIRINRNTLERIKLVLQYTGVTKKEIAETLLNGIIDYPESCKKILSKKLGDEKATLIITNALGLTAPSQ